MYKYIIRRLLLAVPVLRAVVADRLRADARDARGCPDGADGGVRQRQRARSCKKLRKDLGLDLPYYRAVLHLGLADGDLQPGILHLHQRADRGRPEEGHPRHHRAGGARDDPGPRRSPFRSGCSRPPVRTSRRTMSGAWSPSPACPCRISGSGRSSSRSPPSGSAGSHRSATPASGSRRGRTSSSSCCPPRCSAFASPRRPCA